MSQRVWLVSVLAVALGGLGIVVERSSSQESSQEGSQPQTEGRGDFGGGGEFGGRGGGGGEFDGGRGGYGRGGGESRGGGFGVAIGVGSGFGGSAQGRGGGYAGFGTVASAEDSYAQALPAPTVPRIWVTADPGRTEELFEILKSPITSSGIDFPDDTALAEIMTYLSEEHDVPILLDTVALDELGIGVDEPVGISIRNVRLGQAMRRILEPLELTYVIDGGVLLVTSEEEALTKLTVAVYDVRDLLLQGDYDSLIELITATIASDTWAENGGGEAEIRAYPQRGSLVISQTTTVHEEIAGLLGAMRAAPLDPDATPPNLPRGGGMGGGRGAECGGEHEATDEPTPALGS